MTVSAQDNALVLRGAAGVLYHCLDEEVCIVGGGGTGKSVGACKKIVDRCFQYPYSQHLICRQTRASMTDSTLVTLESVIGEDHPAVQNCARKQRHSYELGSSEIVIAGLDEDTKHFGTGWATIMLDEGIEAAMETWELFGRGARDPRIRRAANKHKQPKHQRMIVTNPGPISHWINSRACKAPPDLNRMGAISYDGWNRLRHFNQGVQPGPMRRLLSVHFDNPRMFDARNWAWTEEGESYLKSLRSMSGHRYQRLFLGEWCQAEGSVYPEFQETKHVIEPFPIPREWPCYLVKDPGRDHPDATLVACVTPLEQLIIVAESITGNASDIKRSSTTEEDARTIDRLFSPNFRIVKKLGDPHMMFSETKFAQNGETIAKQMANYGHQFEPAPAARNQAEIAQQCDMVRTRLKSIGRNGRPMLQVFNTCTATIRGFQTWSYDRDTRGQIKGGEDRFSDVGDDEMDCVRMLVASKPTFEVSQSGVFRR